jgi:hypothetical protein
VTQQRSLRSVRQFQVRRACWDPRLAPYRMKQRLHLSDQFINSQYSQKNHAVRNDHRHVIGYPGVSALLSECQSEAKSSVHREQLGKPLGDFGSSSKYSSLRESLSEILTSAGSVGLTPRRRVSELESEGLAWRQRRIESMPYRKFGRFCRQIIKHQLLTTISLTWS